MKYILNFQRDTELYLLMRNNKRGRTLGKKKALATRKILFEANIIFVTMKYNNITESLYVL